MTSTKLLRGRLRAALIAGAALVGIRIGFLDVRGSDQYRGELGHISGSVNR